jgi:2-aminoethylphosphonate aminotransferase
MVERKILLNPGPATTTDTVKQALVIPDVCPRERAFCELYADVRRRLAALVGDPNEVAAIPLVGSGTTALEAVMTSLVPPDANLLVIDNGDYGTRLADMARALDVRHGVLEVGWAVPIDPDAVDARLREAEEPFTHVWLVHHETSSGLLNPVPPLLAVFRRHGVRVLLDAMSSFACLPTPVGRDGVDAVVSSSNKCVQGMAGLGIVVATRALLDEARGTRRRCFTLDLVAEHDHLEKTGQSRFTVPPQIVSALHRALVELEDEGLAERQARYARSMEVLVRGLEALGFELLLERGEPSRILVAIRAPEEPWYDFDAMHDALDAEGFTIYPGKPGSVPTFRLAVLGAIDHRDIEAFVSALGRYVESVRGTA